MAELGVRFKEPPEGYEDVTGTVVHVFGRDYANMTDLDVTVLWSDGRRTDERAVDLTVINRT